MKRIKTGISGILMGLANIVPGISGGTILVLLGIYDDTIDASSGILNPAKRRKSLEFLFWLLAGVAFGIVFGSFTVKHFLELNYSLTMIFFGGLILFSTPKYISMELKQKTKFKVIPFAICFTLLLLTIWFTRNVSKGTPIDTVPELEFQLLFFLFISGIIAGAAMIFPGISGSMIMLMMGSYTYFTSFISLIFKMNFNLFIYLGFIGFGVLSGIILSIRISKYLLEEQRDTTFSIITALIYASTVGMFIKAIPSEFSTSNLIYSLIVLFASLVLIGSIELLGKKIKTR